MTWRYIIHLFLLVSLTLIDPSEEGCYDTIDFDKWSKSVRLNATIDLIQTNNSQDILECSLERKCINRPGSLECCILRDCFDRVLCEVESSEKCKGETFKSVKFYHFMCWVAKAQEYDDFPKYCDDYETVCEVYKQIPFPPITDQTTLPPTLPESTAIPTTSTTLPLTTTTLPESTAITTTSTTLPLTTTTLPESTATTTTTTTLSLTTTTLRTATTKVISIPTGNNRGRFKQRDNPDASKQDTETLTLKIFLVISVILNVAGLLFFCRQRRRQTGPQQDVVNEALVQLETDSQSNTLPISTNGNEVELLMQDLNNTP